MKINITKKEYATLLDIFEIAGWVLHAHLTEEDSERKEYKDLEQKFYSYAKDFGFNKLIRYEKKLGKFFPTKEFEDNSLAHNYIDEFENIAFWEQLIERLVFRDLLRQEGEDNIRNMAIVEKFRKEDHIREKYEKEFEENGITNIEIRA